MLTAFGYDLVPGNLAGALALREAGEAATRIDVGYYTKGGMGGMSGGTRASAAGAMLEAGFVWRDGIRTERGAARVRDFHVGGRTRPAISVGGSEHFTLPRIHPGLREVNAYLGWFAHPRPMQAMSAVNSGLARIPGVKRGMDALVGRFVETSTGGPDAEARAGTGSEIVAIAYGPGGEELATVEVGGVNVYTFTGNVLAWGAATAAAGGIEKSGALGPGGGVRARRARGRLRRGRDHPRRRLERLAGGGSGRIAVEVELDPVDHPVAELPHGRARLLELDPVAMVPVCRTNVTTLSPHRSSASNSSVTAGEASSQSAQAACRPSTPSQVATKPSAPLITITMSSAAIGVEPSAIIRSISAMSTTSSSSPKIGRRGRVDQAFCVRHPLSILRIPNDRRQEPWP